MMKRQLKAGVSVGVVGAMLLAVVPFTAQAADAAPVVLAVQASGTTDPADRYWGLPAAIVGDVAGMPMSQVASAFAGLVKDAGSGKYLPGFHPQGLHVLRGNAPEIGRIAVPQTDGAVTVTVPVEARSAIVGTRSKGAHEDVAVQLTVVDAAGKPVVSHTSWRGLDESRGTAMQRQDHTFSLTADEAAKVKALPPDLRDKNLVVTAYQVIDTDGRRAKGRWTAEHFKTSTVSLGASRAAAQSSVNGQGVYLTVQNNDAVTNSSGTAYQTVNLTQQPNACMQVATSGTTGLNVTGLAYGATTEGYLQQDAGDALEDMAVNQTEDGVQAMFSSVAAEVVSQTFAEVTDVLYVFFKALKFLDGLDKVTCKNSPGLFTMTVADSWGNSTQQAYGLNEFFADGSGYDSNGGSFDTGGAGGMADISTVYNSSLPPGLDDGMSADQNAFFTNYNSYLVQVYGANGIGPAPLSQPIAITQPSNTGQGGEAIQGGDAGLSFTVIPNSTNGETAYSWGDDNAYPDIDLSVSSAGTCSSVFGGTWGTDYATDADGIIEGLNNPAQFWEATTPSPGCAVGANPPNVVNPADWGTVSITAPVGVGGAPEPVSAGYVGETLTASATLTPALPGPSFAWAWFSCGTDATCSSPTLLSDADGSTAWNAGFGSHQSSIGVTQAMSGTYVTVGSYPSSLGGINPGTIAYASPVLVAGPPTVGASGLALSAPAGATTATTGMTLTATTPNNWQNVAVPGTTVTYSTTWYGCVSPTSTTGAGTCTDTTGTQNAQLGDGASYTVPGESSYQAVFFGQTAVVTYPDGSQSSGTGYSNTVPISMLAAPTVTAPTITATYDGTNGMFTGTVSQAAVVTGTASAYYSWIACPTPTACGTPASGNWQPLGFINGPYANLPASVSGQGSSSIAYWTPGFGEQSSNQSVVLQVTAANSAGTTTAYSNVITATDSYGTPVALVAPGIGTYCSTTAGKGCPTDISIEVVQGVWSLPVSSQVTVSYSYTVPGSTTAVAGTYTGSVEGAVLSVPAGSTVTATVQVFGLNGSPLGSPVTTILTSADTQA